MTDQIENMTPAVNIDATSFTRVEYESLNARQKENYNFHKIAAAFADFGFNCIKLADDWMGADFLAYHKDGNNTLKVQLKGRPTIDRKYTGKGLHIAFPANGFWYVIDHDTLVDFMRQHTNWLNTQSWIDAGSYSAGTLTPAVMDKLSQYKFGPVYK